MAGTRLLTNHTRVLLCIARTTNFRGRDIAQQTGLTEHSVSVITSDLCKAGSHMTKHRVGARNYYEIHSEQALHDPDEGHHQLGDLLRVLLDKRTTQAPIDSHDGEPAT